MGKEELSFIAFLRDIYKNLKEFYKEPDPYACAIIEFFINIFIAGLLFSYVHPLTAIITIPWTILRFMYWVWRDMKSDC